LSLNADPRNRDSCCKARAKSGKPCRAAATAGGLCFFHANPNKASELGRIGGKSKRSAPAQSADPLPKVDTTAVRDALTQLIADVRAGRLQPKVAACLAPLLNLQLRAIEATDIEQRVAELEKLLVPAEDYLEGRNQVPVLERGDLPSHFSQPNDQHQTETETEKGEADSRRPPRQALKAYGSYGE
jgi:hypothetical protein